MLPLLRCCLLFLALMGRISAVDAPAGADPSGKAYDWKATGKPERPWIHAYHQTVVSKIFLAERLPDGGSKTVLTFEQALEVIKRLDALTLGIPKIVYLTGWQHEGHDARYPDWSVVNPRLKREQDATAVDSLKWLMAEGFKYHTTVSLHINMFDAYASSPLWQTYLKNDIIAKREDGTLILGEVQGSRGLGANDYTQSYYISYAREWETGFARKRIDALLAMLPIRKAGTIHIDAFHTLRPVPHAYPQEKYPDLPKSDRRISPFLNISHQRETEAQRMIYRYFRDQGVDVTAEGSSFLRSDPLIGLQPMAWRYAPIKDVPPELYCGTPMHAEDEIRKDPTTLKGLLDQFCTKVVPWHYANNTTATKGTQPIKAGDDHCVPALWLDHTLVAYSTKGCKAKAWTLPPDWTAVRRVSIATLSVRGPENPTEVEINGAILNLTLGTRQGVVIRALPGK